MGTQQFLLVYATDNAREASLSNQLGNPSNNQLQKHDFQAAQTRWYVS